MLQQRKKRREILFFFFLNKDWVLIPVPRLLKGREIWSEFYWIEAMKTEAGHKT
jgi:hypothetical protein